MQIPLQDFEQHINESILEKGLSYFKKGRVSPIDELSAGKYSCQVTGTEQYDVHFQINNDAFTNFYCSCPYDSGPVCKHISAAIFYLRQDELNLNTQIKSNKKPNSKTKKVEIARQIDTLLNKIAQENLFQFVRNQAIADTSFRRALTSAFPLLNENESTEFYAQQVQEILKKSEGTYGYIDRRSARQVGKAIEDLLTSAQKQFDNRNFQTTFYIARAVMEEMSGALNTTDDSEGIIGGSIEDASGLLFDLAELKSQKHIQIQLFDFSIMAYEKGIFSGWDWHLLMLNLAASSYDTEEDVAKLVALLDKIKKKEYDYEYREGQRIKLDIIKQTKGTEAAEQYLQANLANSYFRVEAIQNAMSKMEYAKAIELAMQGIKQDEKDRPGLVTDWYNWLLKIAQEQQDSAKIIQFARYLFLDNFSTEADYYAILKSSINKEDWLSFAEGLAQELIQQNPWRNIDRIARIYKTEALWEKLFLLLKDAYLKDSISIEHLIEYEKPLAKLYSEELITLYEEDVLNSMKVETGRSHYKRACRIIRRMIKLGTRDRAENLIKHLADTYPQRRALLEELQNI